MNRIAKRPATAEDAAFLFALFREVRGPEFAAAGLAPAQLDMLLEMQFRAQAAGYSAQYPDAEHSIILADGVPAGRIWVQRSPEEFLLVDISMLGACRNRGIGSALLRELVVEARAAGVPLRSSVAVTNPASLRFHQRLGFTIAAQDEVYYDLVAAP
jgi:ribosomal protein S18 acetylase RimI-like enzyme